MWHATKKSDPFKGINRTKDGLLTSDDVEARQKKARHMVRPATTGTSCRNVSWPHTRKAWHWPWPGESTSVQAFDETFQYSWAPRRGPGRIFR